jgi:hypothetical protein
MAYITAADVKKYERLVADLTTDTIIDGVLERIDDVVNDLAYSKGVQDLTLIETNPLNINVFKYALSSACSEILFSMQGVNGMITNEQDERYYVKANQWEEKKEYYSKLITRAMFLGTVADILDTVTCSPMYRAT